ncbi:helix-turn-helix domain-containing protein, partial [Neisseria musculi]
MEAKTIGERIRKMRKERNLTQQDLARKLKDVSHVAISQWESNTTKPNAENLYELSTLFGCDFGWLLKGEDGGSTNVKIIPNVFAVQIPILRYEDIREFDVAHPLISITGEYIMTDIQSSTSTFALKLKDDSMRPAFSDGDVIIIDPLENPDPGEFVLAQVGNDILFRKYRIDNLDKFSLRPLDSDYPVISSSEAKIKII